MYDPGGAYPLYDPAELAAIREAERDDGRLAGDELEDPPPGYWEVEACFGDHPLAVVRYACCETREEADQLVEEWERDPKFDFTTVMIREVT
jgi:hypothetical protein